MNKKLIFKTSVAAAILVLITALVLVVLSFSSPELNEDIFGGKKVQTIKKTETVERLMSYTNSFIVVKHKQLGGSHYAYTAALAETNTSADVLKEYTFRTGSELVGLSLIDNGDGTVSTFEKVLVSCGNGVVRDPSVSFDGTTVLFSMKKDTNDDYHIYELELTSGKFNYKQLTFGNGRSDIEPQYLANGNIIFSSNRDVQTVDCWITPVSNLYIMDGDGNNIRRVGYDQVHTTFPTVASDGRVLYTRWDYNDRTQMYVQGLFQMFQDGTYQTEVFGNDANFPTTLLHTRDIPGSSGKYVSVASGHHVNQLGKLVLINTNNDRNDKSAVSFLYPDSGATYGDNIDGYGQSGRVFKYPYALDDRILLVSSSDEYSNSSTPYNIYLCDMNGSWKDSVVLVKGTENRPASQIVPVKLSSVFNRVSTVDYSKNTGTYYVADVYAGESMKGITRGTVKYLRVVKLEFRSSAIGATWSRGSGEGDPFSPISTGNGAWDVKCVLGIVPVEEDGSALFRVPSDTPVYFQLLDENGCMIQTMRSWSTLMPGESFSCVGCHENKNTAPASGGGITMAMKKGVQNLQKDLWMADLEGYENQDPYNGKTPGFSYVDLIQPIFDSSCIVCHSNVDKALSLIKADSANAKDSERQLGYLISKGSVWSFDISDGRNGVFYAPFGNPVSGQNDVNTLWSAGNLTLKKDFIFTQYNKDVCDTQLELKYSGNIVVKINGETVYSDNSSSVIEKTVRLSSDQTEKWINGSNEIEVTVSGGTFYCDCALYSASVDSDVVLFEKSTSWKYLMSSSGTVDSNWNKSDFDDSSWKTGSAPFGDRGGEKTSWTGDNNYIWIRKSFELTEEQYEEIKNGALSLYIFYDDTMRFYINGKQYLDKSGWNDSYETIAIDGKAGSILQVGKNVVAISLHNTGGGRQIDTSLTCSRAVAAATSKTQFSLNGKPINPDNNRMRREFPLSYLLLTGSAPSSRGNQVSGINWLGNSNGVYVKWVSCMSQPEPIKPYVSGAYRSVLIKKLRSGHGNLTEEQIRLIECWIDLGVPCFGSYDENEAFSENEMRMFVERENKRSFYDSWDKYVKMDLGEVLPEGTIEASYKASNGKTYTRKGDGYVILNVSAAYKAGDVLTVKLTGASYVGITLNERQGEALLYLPDGTFKYTIPSDYQNISNVTMQSLDSGNYRSFTILIRIPTAKELAEEHNLALNPYDFTDSDVFPHASGVNLSDNKIQHSPMTAIDGFISNLTDGSWPYQACAMKQNGEYRIDFGREVTVNSLQILLRSARNDSHLLTAKVVFSDGTEKEIMLHDTDKFMTFDIGGIKTEYVVIKDMISSSDSAFAFTEVRVLGTEK